MSKPDALAVKIVQLKQEAMKRNLFKTMHALDLAAQKIGWEISEQKKAELRQ